LSQLEVQLRDRYFHSLLGSRLQVLVESFHPDRVNVQVGTSCRYAPVEIKTPSPLPAGQLVDLVARDLVDGHILATGQPSGNCLQYS